MSKRVENPNKYCNFYKKFIVEELILLDTFFDFHYGNCATIGKILKIGNSYFLENIRLTFLEKKYQLPEGSVKIRLITNIYQNFIPDKKTVEVYGNAVFYNCKLLKEDKMPITLHDIYYQFNEYLDINNTNNENRNSNLEMLKQTFNQKLLDKYEPAILVRFINLCDQAEDLIAYNLKIRLLS